MAFSWRDGRGPMNIRLSLTVNDESRELLTMLGMPFQAVEAPSGKGK